MAGNRNLHDSAKNKQDEFYTNLTLVEDELKHYRAHFRGARVLCNCDDPYESNFFKYFAMNFNVLGLKSLTATCYATSPVVCTQLDLFGDGTVVKPRRGRDASRRHQPYKIVITEVRDENQDGRIDLSDVEWLIRNRKNVLTRLAGDGDFRSPECVALLDETDIVVTNPPFSLFREYMALLMEHGKRFLVIGNMNAVTYREIFPLIKANRVWLGNKAGHFWFKVPDHYEAKATDFRIDADGQKWRRMGNICWFTNLDFPKRHEKLLLWKRYTPEAYPKYDNYDAIEVAKTADIPCDWYEAMGVPITFIDKYNPEQFELLGIDKEFTTDGGRFLLAKDSYTGGGAFICSSRDKKEALREILINEYGYREDELEYRSGFMGVPITFMQYYNPEQFEIVGATESEGVGFSEGLWDATSGVAQPLVNGGKKYKRIFIRRKGEVCGA